MAVKPIDPTRYSLKVVSFSLVREPGDPATQTVSAPAQVATIARQIIADDAKEHMWILLLNTQNRMIAAHHVSTGTLSASLVHPREVFAPAMRIMGVAALVLVHNHPSGDPTPSGEDVRLTHQLVSAARLLDLRVHDHVIIGNGSARYTSLAESGRMEG